MIRPMKFQKNSFIFLETIFSILILSSLVAIYLKIGVTKEQKEVQLSNIENQFLKKEYGEYFSSASHNLNFIKNDNDVYTINVNQITYNNSKVKLVQYEQ